MPLLLAMATMKKKNIKKNGQKIHLRTIDLEKSASSFLLNNILCVPELLQQGRAQSCNAEKMPVFDQFLITHGLKDRHVYMWNAVE